MGSHHRAPCIAAPLAGLVVAGTIWRDASAHYRRNRPSETRDQRHVFSWANYRGADSDFAKRLRDAVCGRPWLFM